MVGEFRRSRSQVPVFWALEILGPRQRALRRVYRVSRCGVPSAGWWTVMNAGHPGSERSEQVLAVGMSGVVEVRIRLTGPDTCRSADFR